MYEKLLHVGLTSTEAKIYLMLIDISKAQAGVLSRRTGIHRRSIYDALDRLIEKGLVSYIIENDKRYYMPTDPSRIQDMIDQQHVDVSSIMPTLLAKFYEQKDKQQTFFYRGKEGIKTVFEDQIKVGKDIYIIGASREVEKHLKYYLPHYTKKRVKKKIRIHALYALPTHEKQPPSCKIKYLPRSFRSLVSTNIYGSKAVIFLWLPHDPVAIQINQPDIAKTFKQYFDLLWGIAT
jgi:sugar-specific transcriptional regulator TrmB